MKIAIRSFLPITACALLAACASVGPAPTPWWTISDAAMNKLKPGSTTQAEVRAIVGTPMLISKFPRQNEETWDYRYLEGSTLVNLAWLTFDAQGVLKSYMLRPDPAFQTHMD